VCFSLLSSTGSMGRSGEISDFKRGLVMGCQISKNLSGTLQPFSSCPSDVIVKWKNEGTTTTKARPGRPYLMTDRDRRALKAMVPETYHTSSETLTREFRSATNCPASTVTMRPSSCL
jgi:hypothetical protein